MVNDVTRSGPYVAHDRERWIPEPGKNPTRSAFQRDRARIVHSAALRRLGAKTQVLGAGSDDFVRNRLTHSLEVAQVGRELGKALGCDPDVVDAACLSHDLGHPPFGHNGERALAEIAAPVGGFEGNAQTLRLLTRLEPKAFAPNGASVGLNLTRASLDAATKYPWPAREAPLRPNGTRSRKFGVYDDDLEVFHWLRAGAKPGKRCIEAQVMDLADDISYSVHDVEDAIVGGHLDPADLRRDADQQLIVAQTRKWYDPPVRDDELGEALRRLINLPEWVASWDGTRRDLAALKNLTSQLIGRFCGAAHDATRAAAGEGPLTRYAADLVVPNATTAEIVVLKGVAAHYVMAPREQQPMHAHQRRVLQELVGALLEAGPDELEAPFAADWHAADADQRLRVVIDQVASLTDASAHEWHRRLCGAETAAGSRIAAWQD